MAQAHGLGVVLYSPLAGGLLTGQHRHGEQGRLSTRGDAALGRGADGDRTRLEPPAVPVI